MILMFGDVHGDFKHVLPVVQKEKPAAIIFLGDLDLDRPFELEVAQIMKLTEVYFIHGNHDTDSQDKHDFLFNSRIADRNLHCRVVDIDGLKVAGLGGIFREKIWWPKYTVDATSHHNNYEAFVDAELQIALRQEKRNQNNLNPNESPVLNGKRLTHKSTIFQDDWMKLYGLKADILVTHEAPDCHPYGFAGITELAKGMKVSKTFHGHHHDRIDYSVHYERLGFQAHGVGLCGVSNSNGALVLAGKQDVIKVSRNV